VVLPLLIFIAFARMLPPAEVGIVALAVAWSEILKGLGAPGLYEALLQQHEEPERHHETALSVLLVAGLLLLPAHVLAVAVTIGASEAPGLLALGAVGLRIVFDLATLQPQARLAGSLSYRRLALRSVVANAGAGAIGIGVALLGQPMLGLIIYQVGQSALLFLTTVIGTGALARPRFHRDCARAMSREAGLASANRFIAGAINYLDQLAVAAVLDPRRLAYFNLAKRVEMSLVTAAVSFNSILFQPLFAQRDMAPEARERGIARGLAVIGLVCGLPTAVFATNAEGIVAAVFGEPWRVAAPVAAALAFSGFARALGFPHIGLMSVSGRNHLILSSTTASALAGALLILLVAPWGLVWGAAAIAVKNSLVTAWMAYATRVDAPRPLRLYGLEVLLPFGLMLAGAALGRWGAEAVLIPLALPGALTPLGVLAASGLAAALPAGLYLLRRYGVPGRLRGRVAGEGAA
jgi:O-antigen/teichoic acid export membrane protein